MRVKVGLGSWRPSVVGTAAMLGVYSAGGPIRS